MRLQLFCQTEKKSAKIMENLCLKKSRKSFRLFVGKKECCQYFSIAPCKGW